ncbi:DEAD/DEAH box helicase [Micromonospora zamorensis]|uniref:DEAD/DEAH box helicase n=1 Tax=Micromonospora zamorensis TaxID=709883 RepID=UPI002E1B2FFB
MTEQKASVELNVDGDDLLVSGPTILIDRRARLFFQGMIGASPVEGGWRCPRRRLTTPQLIFRVYEWLEARGFQVSRGGIAEAAIERELARRRSFERTREAARRLKSGEVDYPYAAVDEALRDFGFSRSLREHQRTAVAHGLTAVNAANFSVPGAGKTATTLAVASAHLHAGTVDLIVVVGPLACFDPWERETAASLGDRLLTRRVRGHSRQRREIYNTASRGQLILLSYATAAADEGELAELFEHHKVMLIVDESHRVKRFKGGVWAPALMGLSKRAVVRIILSGTPMPQSGRDLYAQLNYLWPDGQLTGTRDVFANRVDRDFDSVIEEVSPFVVRTPKAALGLPPYSVQRHEVPLVGIQAEIYQLVASRFRQQLSDAENWADKIDVLRRARPLRLMQAATNPNLLNTGDQFYRASRVADASPTLMERLATYPDLERPAKSLAAVGLVREIAASGGKVVCWSNFISNLDEFSQLLRDVVKIPVYQIDGRVPAGNDAMHPTASEAGARELPGDFDTREQIIDRFLNTDGPAALVTNPASCSESISLHSTCHNAIYLDRTYDCALFLQSIDRIHRLGLPEGAEVRIHVLLATLDGCPTIDGLIDSALERKSQNMQQLLEGADLLPISLAEDPIVDAEGDGRDLAELLAYLLGGEAG